MEECGPHWVVIKSYDQYRGATYCKQEAGKEEREISAVGGREKKEREKRRQVTSLKQSSATPCTTMSERYGKQMRWILF